MHKGFISLNLSMYRIISFHFTKRKRYIMLFHNNFTKNIKLLRSSHYISMNDLATMLDFKNKGTIGQMETGKALPSYEKLVDISNLFAVSLDWLVGRTTEPYSEEIISHLEDSLMDTKLSSESEFGANTPIYYSDYEQRKINYSLSERANIVFLLQYLKMLTEQNPSLLTASPKEASQLNNFISSISFFRAKRFKDTEERYLFVLRGLSTVLLEETHEPLEFGCPPVPRTPAPIFDLHKAIAEQE